MRSTEKELTALIYLVALYASIAVAVFVPAYRWPALGCVAVWFAFAPSIDRYTNSVDD